MRALSPFVVFALLAASSSFASGILDRIPLAALTPQEAIQLAGVVDDAKMTDERGYRAEIEAIEPERHAADARYQAAIKACGTTDRACVEAARSRLKTEMDSIGSRQRQIHRKITALEAENGPYAQALKRIAAGATAGQVRRVLAELEREGTIRLETEMLFNGMATRDEAVRFFEESQKDLSQYLNPSFAGDPSFVGFTTYYTHGGRHVKNVFLAARVWLGGTYATERRLLGDPASYAGGQVLGHTDERVRAYLTDKSSVAEIDWKSRFVRGVNGQHLRNLVFDTIP